jgi:hypothetical protein
MKDSFYYFFSAVPQVLATILALFGVFVLFKLQSLTIELLSVGEEFLDKTEFIKDENDCKDRIVLRNKIHSALFRSVDSKNIMTFKENLDLSTNNKIYQGDKLVHIENKFNNIYSVYKSLKNETIKSSFFTAIIIIICLAIIPFEKWLICYSIIVYVTFTIIIICISIIFYKLISILKKSFN